MNARCFALALLIGTALSEATAGAQSAKPTVAVADRLEAKKLSALGRSLLAQKKGDAALDAFERSYALDPQPTSLAGIGDAYASMGRNADAYETYERALVEPGDPLLPHERKRVEKALVELNAKTGTLTVTADVDGATISVDGRVVGKSPWSRVIRLDVGTHEVKVSKPGRLPFTGAVLVTGGDTRTLAAVLPPEATTGKVIVREASGKPSRVWVEGLLVGDAPVHLSAGPGQYRIELEVTGKRGEPRVVDVQVGETIELALDAPEPPIAAPVAAADDRCETDEDCDEGERCSKGACKQRKKPKPAPAAPAPAAPEGAACGDDDECATGLKCDDGVCRAPKDLSPRRRVFLGLTHAAAIGVTGERAWPAPLHAIGLELGVPIAQSARFGSTLSFSNVNGSNGVRLETIGFAWSVPLLRGPTTLYLEPYLHGAVAQGLFGDGLMNFVLGANAGLGVAVHTSRLRLSFAPVGLEIDYLRAVGNGEQGSFAKAGGGSWLLRSSVGVTF